ncbi:MAG TPA: glucose-6-phosphate dehydrogenase assembly protein OpcA [Gaiellaceae bacterium]|nr:glucose-6-phosphate dehydrogenase assembly protein OpcA [Gaiellaceae bacterium]
MAQALKDTSVVEIERCLDALQAHDEAAQRTSVATHVAWVPAEWSRAAERVLRGLGPRHPSRTLVLHPDPGARTDRLDATLEHDCFCEGGVTVCAEVVRLWLRGCTARAPASVVVPLQLPDLPAFLRWRGKPPFGRPELDQLVGVADRLIVDSGEWSGLRPAYGRVAGLFDRVAVSDLAWARTLRWRAGLAELWPGIRDAKVLRVTGPEAEALLLAGWLRSRLRREVSLRRRDAPTVRGIELDGASVAPAPIRVPSRSDLLSEQLELFGRDRVYEAAVRAV